MSTDAAPRGPLGELFVGIDAGTSGVKVLAVDAAGTAVASASAGYPLATPRPGWVEQDPDDWWTAVCAATRRLIAEVPGGAGRVAAIGLSGHMSSLVALDPLGRPVRPCMTLTDARCAAEAAELAVRHGPRFQALAGTLPTTAAIAPRLVWLRRYEPEAYARAATIVSAKDYVRLRLAGTLGSEPTDAGNTLLLDVRTREWDTALCSDLGLDPAKLPALAASTDVVGRVTAAAAEATGLRQGTPVVAGGADMATSVTGTGTVIPGVVAVTIGTAAQVTAAIRALPAQVERRITFHPHAMPGWLYAMGSIFAGGLALRWIASALGDAPVRAEDPAYLAGLSAEAATAPAGSDGALFLPFLVGSGSPEFDGAMRGTFLGLSLATDRARLVRSVLEGVAFNARECVDVLRDLGVPVERIHMGGGGAASATWRGIVASVLGMPVHPIRVRDASALGAAALAAVGTGAYRDVAAASQAMVALDPAIEPDPAAIARYEDDYRTYVRARLALRDVYRHAGTRRGEKEGVDEGTHDELTAGRQQRQDSR